MLRCQSLTTRWISIKRPWTDNIKYTWYEVGTTTGEWNAIKLVSVLIGGDQGLGGVGPSYVDQFQCLYQCRSQAGMLGMFSFFSFKGFTMFLIINPMLKIFFNIVSYNRFVWNKFSYSSAYKTNLRNSKTCTVAAVMKTELLLSVGCDKTIRLYNIYPTREDVHESGIGESESIPRTLWNAVIDFRITVPADGLSRSYIRSIWEIMRTSRRRTTKLSSVTTNGERGWVALYK